MIKDILRSIKCSFVYDAYRKPLQSNLVVFTSRNGKDLAGNMLRLLIELHKQYGNEFKYVVGLEKQHFRRIHNLLDSYGLSDVILVKYDSIQYLRILERAKYLLNDSTFPIRYIKREGQIYLNTWHGTPLKMMGDDSPSVNSKHRTCMDNIQRNLFCTDYFLAPSDYCQDKMTSAYCMKNLYKGIILRDGYPRNSVFFDERMRKETTERYGLTGKRIITYMPTFRDAAEDAKSFFEKLLINLRELDNCLSHDEVLFVKLHYYDQNRIQADRYKHIRLFPNDIETYEFLNIVDCLVTDFSSVLYDFSVTRKKIIRFVFDERAYSEERGLYEQPVPFPFPVVTTVQELIRELRAPKNYKDELFLSTYCPNEGPDVSERIIRHVFGQVSCCEEKSLFDTTHEKVLLFSGALSLNGITTSAQNLMELVDDDRLYYVSYTRKMLEGHEDLLENLPANDGIIEISGSYCCTFPEMLAFLFYYKYGTNWKLLRSIINSFYKREALRTFQGMTFDSYINFDGYGTYITGLFQNAKGMRIIYVHNDMLREIELKKNQNLLSLRDAYRCYDMVAVVAEGLKKSVAKISGRVDNIQVVHNCQNAEKIRRRGEQPIKLQNGTIVTNAGNSSIENFLSSHQKIFITIGRFSREKRHKMLINAFDKLDADNIGLIIIGGLGDIYKETICDALSAGKSRDIMVIYAISNPMPILKHADLFLLSSEYEGMPMVLFEAECMGVPSVSVDTPGAHEFMEKFGGVLVEDSEEGLVRGMKMFLDGQIGTLGIDFFNYNQMCLKEFENCFVK